MKLLKWVLFFAVLFTFANGQASDAIDETGPELTVSTGTVLGETQQDQAPTDEVTPDQLPENAFAPISEQKMAALLKEFGEKSVAVCHRSVSAGWAVATDVGNKEKEQEKVR